MLLIKETIKVAQPEGANIAQQTEVGKRRMETNYGPKYDPIFECLAVGGTPFTGIDTVTTPIALRVGDEVQVDQESGFMVAVLREGVQIWPAGSAAEPEPQGKRGKA